MLTATLCVALSGAGLAAALLTAWRRRFLAATRLAALALLPIGLYLAGLVTLGARIGQAVGSWGAGLVLNPAVWAGFTVLVVAVLLYLAARLAAGRAGRGATGPSESRSAAAPGAPGAPASARGGKAATRELERRRTASTARDDDLSEFKDIEEILRKRGI